MQLKGFPQISADLINSLISILPSNSAIAFQESNQTEVDLNMITDQNWDRESYLLTVAVYQPAKGLVGLRQKTVDII